MFIHRHECSIKHFQISQVVQQCGSVYILDRHFNTLEELVSFYSRRDVPNIEAIRGVRLTFAVVYSAGETENMPDDVLAQRRFRRVSAGDVALSHSSRALSCTDSSSSVFRQSMSESHSDDGLLSNDMNWCTKIIRTLKHANRKKRAEAQSQAVQSVTSCVVDTDTRQPHGSLSENPKKYEKQPAIPDDSDGPAVASLSDGAGALAAAAANYNAAATDTDGGLYYSEPRDVDRNLSTDFIARLLQHDQDYAGDNKCVCGLDMADSELPRGWSMHKSTERGTEGRLFFTSPTGETSWELPTIVSVDLDTRQQDRIRELMIEGENAARAAASRQQVSLNHPFLDADKRISV